MFKMVSQGLSANRNIIKNTHKIIPTTISKTMEIKTHFMLEKVMQKIKKIINNGTKREANTL